MRVFFAVNLLNTQNQLVATEKVIKIDRQRRFAVLFRLVEK